MRKYLLYTILSIFILSFFVGCNADGVGIFYTLSKEEELSGSDLQGLYIRSFANIGSNVFCGAGPSVWKDNGSSWKNVSKSGYNSDPAIASDGTTIYAALYEEDDTDQEKTIWSYDGSSWTKVTTPFESSTSMWLLDTSGLDFIVRSPDGNDSYDIYSTDYSTITNLNLNTAYPITDAAYDGSGTYVLVGGSYYNDNPLIYHGDGTSFTAATDTVSDPIGGVIYYKDDDSIPPDRSTFYLTTKDGNLWSSTDGDTWDVVDEAPDNYSDDTPLLFDMGVVTFDSTAYLVIGSDEGYYEMDLSGTSISRPEGTIDSDTDIEASYSTFADGYVRCFYTVEDNHFLMGTATGVWENDNGDLDQK
jgi:hypothetical protein